MFRNGFGSNRLMLILVFIDFAVVVMRRSAPRGFWVNIAVDDAPIDFQLRPARQETIRNAHHARG